MERKQTQIDDGRRKMPKSWCPYCHHRVVDSRTVELKKSIELVPLSSPDADHFIVCPNCHKTIGLLIKSVPEAKTMCAVANV